MGFTISQLKQVIREEIEKELSEQDSEMGQEKALNKETKTLDVAKSISSWLQSKGISSKAFGRPAQRYTSLYGGRVGGGYVEPSVVIEFGPKSDENANANREKAWELLQAQFGNSKTYEQPTFSQTIEYIPWKGFIITKDNTSFHVRLGVMSKNIMALKNQAKGVKRIFEQ